MTMVLKDLGYHNKELSILFTNDIHMAQLNQHYLRRDGPTNVMAFPMDYSSNGHKHGGKSDHDLATPMLGDIVISVDTAIREAREYNESLSYTIDRLLIHGLLHLLGYDHEQSATEDIRMQRQEKRLLELIREE